MEYYIYITENCNLRCSYCSSWRVVSKDEKSALANKNIDKVISYISNNNFQHDTLVFFGGEPLLEIKIIDRFIKESAKLNCSYVLYTNGLLLDSTPIKLLNSMDAIFVSLDGDKKSQEKHRGKGTYDRIIDNLKDIKGKINTFLIGRITVEEETNIYKSVSNILENVDAIYWQIVNKQKFNNPNEFINNYKENTTLLYKYWYDCFKNGKIINVIPFLAIISSLIFNNDNDGFSFRCGAGSDLQIIDLNGQVYWCDEYVGDSKGIIGDIYGKKPDMNYEEHTEIYDNCNVCDVSNICLGRCKKGLKEYDVETIKVYCKLTKHLIYMIMENVEELKEIIRKYELSLESFYKVPYITEEIP